MPMLIHTGLHGCPHCGHEDVASDFLNHRDGYARVYTCMRCCKCWNNSGEPIPMPDADPAADISPGNILIAHAD